MIHRIESQNNAEYKRLLQLSNPAKARKESVFLLEGERAVMELPAAWELESLWTSTSYTGALPAAEPCYVLPDSMFAKASETVHSQGILAVVHRRQSDFTGFPAEHSFWIILENLQDPGNAGTILRTADACAADGVICVKGTVDFYNSKVIRASMGSIFHIPFVTVNTIEEAVSFVHENGGQVIGTHLHAEGFYTQVSYQQPTAVIIGNEGNGMSEKAASLCDHLVKIPMPGAAESLNASVAAAVMMYEVLRQREKA